MRISDWSSDVCSSDLCKCITIQASTHSARGSHGRHLRSRIHTHRSLPDHGAGNRTSCPQAGQARQDSLHHSPRWRSEEHTSELQSLMRISYAVFCLKKKKRHVQKTTTDTTTTITLNN